MAAGSVHLEAGTNDDGFKRRCLMRGIEHRAAHVGSGALGFIGRQAGIRFPHSEVHDHVRVEVEDDLRHGGRAIQSDTTEIGAPEAPSRRIGVDTENLADPPVQWRGTDTCIQATGIDQDFGVFDDPDTFYRDRGVNARGVKGWLYANIMRKVMNSRVAGIRDAAVRG